MAGILILLLEIYSFIVLARVLLSWFPNIDRGNPIVVFLYEATEPVLQPIRVFLQRNFPDMGPFDFSPLVLFLLIFVLNRLIVVIF
ncbi:MAG: YggT family protein [Anaerolineae bacterium]